MTAREATHLSVVQVAALLEAAQGSRYRPLFVLLVNTGLRRGEALALRWSDVDLTNGLVRVRGTPPKSARSARTIPLGVAAVEVLRSLKARQAAERLKAGSVWTDSGYVFTTELGEPGDPRNALTALTAGA